MRFQAGAKRDRTGFRSKRLELRALGQTFALGFAAEIASKITSANPDLAAIRHKFRSRASRRINPDTTRATAARGVLAFFFFRKTLYSSHRISLKPTPRSIRASERSLKNCT